MRRTVIWHSTCLQRHQAQLFSFLLGNLWKAFISFQLKVTVKQGADLVAL